MRRLNRKLFGFVLTLVISTPFILHGIGHKGWDPIGQMFGTSGLTSALGSGAKTLQSSMMNQMAVSTIDPAISDANTNSAALGRQTNIEDVWQALNNTGATGNTTTGDATMNGTVAIAGDPVQNNDPVQSPAPTNSKLAGATQSVAGMLGASTTVAPPTFTQTPTSIIASFTVGGVHGTCTITIVNGQAVRTCS